MLRNNAISFLLYLAVDIIILILYDASTFFFRYNSSSKLELVCSIPLFIIAILLFVLIGRFTLKDAGSSIKNLLSVLFTCLVGIVCSINLSGTPPHEINLIGLYFAYTAPLYAIFGNLGSHIIPGYSSLTITVIFSLLPSLLCLFGFRWRIKSGKTT